MSFKITRARLGSLIFILGALLGIWLLGASTWAQFEATLFDADLTGSSMLQMECPRFLMPQETGAAVITLTNPTDKDHSRFIRTHITAGMVTLMHEDARLEPVPAGGSIQVAWPVRAADAVYGGRMIFVRSFVVGRAPLPSASATCGIYVLRWPLPLRGETFMWVSIVLSLVLMRAGFLLWRKESPVTPHWRNLFRGLAILGWAINIGLALMVLGAWFPAAIDLLGIALLSLALLRPIFQG